MRMSKRTRTILIVVVAVIIVALVILFLWWWFHRPVTTTTMSENTGIPTQDQLPSASAGLTADVISITEAKLEATLTAVAMTFTERFGSYSNQGSYTNLDDAKSLMTVRMIAWAENYKASHPIEPTATYNGVSTKALSAKVTSVDETTSRAEVTVQTQRQESQGTTINPRITYQTLELAMVQEGSDWKIDSAEWQ